MSSKARRYPLGEHVLSYTRREPIGVVGAIIPWNSPLLLGALKIAMAITAGNTLVLKAAEDAPLAVLQMAEVCAEHLPSGVLNVLTGYGEEAGAPLAVHPLVRKLSFTGSTEVGKLDHARGGRPHRAGLARAGRQEPGHRLPGRGRRRASGRRGDRAGCASPARVSPARPARVCLCMPRCSTSSSIGSPRKLGQLRIGDPLDESTDMGALINRKQFDRVCGYIQDGLGQPGARVLIGGLPPDDGPLAAGYFVQPTVFAQASNDWRIAREEIFGPVQVAIPWTDEDDVIRMANDSHYGLAAYVWCRDISRALRTAHRIESGWVQVNQGLGQSPGHSYGGYKQSGIGREFSLEGMLDSFTQRKSVTVNLNTPVRQ